MHILLINQHYWPEDYGAGVEVRELAEKLHQFGHEVTVITGMPNYPLGKIQSAYRWPPVRIENLGGVNIIRGWFYTASRLSATFKRGLSALSFCFVSLILSTKVRKPDVILGYSSPIFMGYSAYVLSRIWGVPCVLDLKDLFTKSILAGRLAKTGMLTKIFFIMENFLYRHVDHIITNATYFMEYLTLHGVKQNTVCLIPDWADGSFIKPTPKENNTRADWNLKDCFVILYSGNMGYSSDLETALFSAELLIDLEDVKFVLVGEGVKLSSLQKIVKDKCLRNVQFHPLQPRELYPDVLAIADVSLVTLSQKGGEASTQGKLYSLMAAGLPVIAISSPENDIRQIVERGQFGWWIQTSDASGLATLVRQLHEEKDTLVSLGMKGRHLFDQKYSLDICARKFEEVFISIARQRKDE